MNNVSIRGNLTQHISNNQGENVAGKNIKTSFSDVLKNTISEINELQVDADKAITKVELEDSGSIHEAMIALEKANISFRVMMTVRNKILDAYQEIMRMQV
ncbi:MAG: flagellar hook-basal body complex protein FliE [Deltaproteobacteria bacterium]|nr:flagellar hook-basal body complex protein FliE [Deltaproteobacteria bacterium]